MLLEENNELQRADASSRHPSGDYFPSTACAQVFHSLLITSNCIHFSELIEWLVLRAALHVRRAARALRRRRSSASVSTSFRNYVEFKPNKAGQVTVYTNYEPVHNQKTQNALSVPWNHQH